MDDQSEGQFGPAGSSIRGLSKAVRRNLDDFFMAVVKASLTAESRTSIRASALGPNNLSSVGPKCFFLAFATERSNCQ